jgi:integrase
MKGVISSADALARARHRVGDAVAAQIWGLHVRARAVTQIVGETSAGKTVFLHNLGHHLATGQELLGIAPPRRVRVLHMDFETYDDLLAEHLEAIGTAEGWDFFDLDELENGKRGKPLVEMIETRVREGHYEAFLRHAFNVAIRDEKTERNPVTKLRFFKERGRVRYLMDEEEPKLLKALPSDEDRQRVTALLHTGLRKAEFLGLRWKHVDFKAGVLTIPRSKNDETRHVPMNATVREILGRRPRSLNRDALVFPNGAGMVGLRWAEKTFPEAVSAAQIEDFRLHDLRHTFASRLVMAGVDLLTVMQLGGWKSLAMVQRYGHLSPGHRQSAVERLVSRPVKKETAAAAGAE